MQNRTCRDLSIRKFPSDFKAKEKYLESTDDSQKQKIEAAFVDVDTHLKQVAKAQELQQVNRYVPNIRRELFDPYNECVYHLDVSKFACHESSDKTRVNSRCC